MTEVWAGYGRVSRVGDRADTLISDQQQIDRNAACATAHGLVIEQFPIELDVSGKKKSRPILDKVIAGIESGQYAGVIVPVLDRLSRMDLMDALATIKRIEDAGGLVLSAGEDWDTSTPEGEMARNTMLNLANMMWRRYSAQLASAKAQAVMRGIWPVPRVPLGYRRRADRVLEPDPDTAPLVVRAFEMRAAGQPVTKIAELLDRGPSGTRKLLQNRVYLGEITLTGIATNPTGHEPLVDRALWEACQSQMPRPPRSGREPALLAGIARCAGCRRLLQLDVHKTSGRLYRCIKSSADRCGEGAVIMGHILEPYVEQVALRYLQRLEVAPRQARDLRDTEAALGNAEAEFAAFVEHTRITDVGPEVYTRGQDARRRDVERLRATLARERLAVLPGGHEGLADLWPTLSTLERRHVLRGLLGVVWVRRGRLAVADRVRVVLAGEEPGDLPRPGNKRFPIVPVVWADGDLPGEIRSAGA